MRSGAAAAASASRASCNWAISTSVRSWLSRPRRMNCPVTASSRHNSAAARAYGAGWWVSRIVVTRAPVISPVATTVGRSGSRTAVIPTATVAATAAAYPIRARLIPSRAPDRPGAGWLFSPAVTTIAMSTQPSGRSNWRWRSTRSRARERAALTRADAGTFSVPSGGGGPDGRLACIRPAAAGRAFMDTVWRAAGMDTRSGAAAGPAPGAGSGTGTGPDGHGGRGGGGGQPAPAGVDDDQAGEHVGQRHHDQRGDPGGRAGDLVGDAEPGDGRAGAVGGGDGEGQPRADA